MSNFVTHQPDGVGKPQIQIYDPLNASHDSSTLPVDSDAIYKSPLAVLKYCKEKNELAEDVHAIATEESEVLPISIRLQNLVERQLKLDRENKYLKKANKDLKDQVTKLSMKLDDERISSD